MKESRSREGCARLLSRQRLAQPGGVSEGSRGDYSVPHRLFKPQTVLLRWRSLRGGEHIVGQPFDDRPGYFGFKEAGMI